MKRPLGVLGVVALFSVAAGCFVFDGLFDDNSPICSPNHTTRSCYCEDGASGTQTCEVDGLDFGACVCTPDAGADALPPDGPVSPTDEPTAPPP